jgi:hypothetical protein
MPGKRFVERSRGGVICSRSRWIERVRPDAARRKSGIAVCTDANWLFTRTGAQDRKTECGG